MANVNVKGECRINIIPINSIYLGEYILKRNYTVSDIKYLSDSIKKNGVIQPLVVRRISECEFELISGVRRIKAAVNAGLSVVPCIVLRCTAQQAVIFSIVDNMQRRPIDVFEQCNAFGYIMKKYNISVEDISMSTGQSETEIIQKLKLKCYDNFERKLIHYGNISDESAIIIAGVTKKKIRRKLLYQIYGKDVNRNELTELINKYIHYDINKNRQKEIIVINDIRLFTNSITKAIDLMRKSGKDIVEEKTETNSYIEYRIRIKKSGT